LSAYLLVTKNYGRISKQDVAEMQGFNDLENYYSSQISGEWTWSTTIILYRLTEDEITQNLKKLRRCIWC